MKNIYIKIRNLFFILRFFLSFRCFFLYCNYLQFYFFNLKLIDKINNNYFKKISKNRSFSKNWFSKNIFFWIKFFDKNKLKNINQNILEIGSFEGLSALFFMNYFTKAKLHCVDTFEGGPEQIGIKDFSNLKNTFISNTKMFKSRIKVYKSYSNLFFKLNKKNFNIIYIDGGHDYKTVFSDAKNAFKILNLNGILIFDDYFWRFYKNGKNPINAINDFLKTIKGKYTIELVTTQLFIKKIKK